MLILVITAEDEDVCFPQGGQGLPQGSGGEQPAVAEGAARVQEHDLQVPIQLEMLKAVVQEKNIGAVLPPGGQAGGVAAGSGVHQDAGEAHAQFKGLLAHLRRSIKQALPVRKTGDLAPPSPVPPAEDGHPLPLSLEKPGQVRGHRGLAGASHGKIAHAYHGGREVLAGAPTPLIKPPPKPSPCLVRGGQGPPDPVGRAPAHGLLLVNVTQKAKVFVLRKKHRR